MAKQEKLVKSITSMDEDFAKWYTDVCIKAELIDYASVKGCMIIRPYGYAIWENIQRIMDGMFKELGHENVYMPLFIPESLLQKEKDHQNIINPPLQRMRESPISHTDKQRKLPKLRNRLMQRRIGTDNSRKHG